VRHPPQIVVVGGVIEQWRPYVVTAEDCCGDGEAKDGPPKDHMTLRKWRHNAGLTQTELARRLGVSRATASSWEDSGKSIPARRWKAIAAACGVTGV
jgi:DNA-binding XRE family transcriptional regulator